MNGKDKDGSKKCKSGKGFFKFRKDEMNGRERCIQVQCLPLVVYYLF